MDNPSSLPLISIVTPSLNQGEYIERTIQSVLSQGYPQLEYIVLDGGSNDNTIDVLSKYTGQIIWKSEKDNGQTQAINKGITLAKGEIITYLNADDLLTPKSLWRVGEIFAKKPKVLWLTGRCKIINENDDEIRSIISIYKDLLLTTRNRNTLLVTNYISQPATFLRRNLIEKCGLFNEQLHYVMDYEYWLRAWQIAPPLVLKDTLAAFRVHKNAKTTSSGHSAKYISEEQIVIARHTNSRFWQVTHNIHRILMTKTYSIINRIGS